MPITTQTSEIQRIARSVPEAVQSLTQSNDIPTQRQLDIMHAWKKSLDVALASLPDVETLQRRTVAVAAHRRLYRSVCSAVRRLPVEVLQAIFIVLGSDLDADSKQRGYDVLNVDDGPWALIRVSRLWRAAALGCTELWATMSVGRNVFWTGRKSTFQLREPVALLTAALAHSGQRDLYFHFRDFSSDAYRLLLVLLEHCNRWREAHLEIRSSDLHLLQDLGSRVPRLQNFTYRTYSYGFDVRDQPTVALHKALSLIQLNMVGPPLDVDSVALAQIVKLNYRYAANTGRHLAAYDPLDALTLCPNAEDVSLDPGALPYSDDDWNPLGVDVKEYIHRDRITRFETSDVGLLSFLCLPSLSDLSLFFTDAVIRAELRSKPAFVSPAHLPTLLAFLKRSRCALTNLMLGGADLRSQTSSLADVFALTPGLQRLETSYGINVFRFSQRELWAIRDGMSLLVKTLSNTELLPNLAGFIFASFALGEPAFTFADASFVAMCGTRQPTLQIASLHCLGCPEKGFPTLKRDIEGLSPVNISVHGEAPGSTAFSAMLRGEEENGGSSGLVEE
ncbi:hypothetical protein CPB85DRAFT_1560733 [Mucidula mucida]|nr:hypothetical protein CPB85DRAFT_1560733 [Mucidula mucida]